MVFHWTGQLTFQEIGGNVSVRCNMRQTVLCNVWFERYLSYRWSGFYIWGETCWCLLGWAESKKGSVSSAVSWAVSSHRVHVSFFHGRKCRHPGNQVDKTALTWGCQPYLHLCVLLLVFYGRVSKKYLEVDDRACELNTKWTLPKVSELTCFGAFNHISHELSHIVHQPVHFMSINQSVLD